MNEIKYIGNAPERGISYDWHFLRKKMKELGIPSDFYNPITAPLESAQWFVEVSERAVGKTTGWLLLGAVMFEYYGTVTIYVRSRKENIAPKNAISLYHVVKANGYISKITHEKWNTVIYDKRKWFFANVDENGNLLEKCNEYFCRMVSIDSAGDLKSNFNEPKGDLLIYDEFIPISSRYEVPNEFVQLVDLCSTVFRLRECPKIVLLANNINKYSQYFNDLEIADRISEMQISENCIHTTNKGTKIYIEFIGAPKRFRTKKTVWNRLFAGFQKPELASITGESTWAVHCYQHIPELQENEEIEILFNKIYIYYQNKYVRLDIVENPTLGVCIYAHWATKVYNDSIILTNENIIDERYIFGNAAGTKLGKFLDRIIRERKLYFAANDVGNFVEGFFSICGIYSKIFF